jgi:tripartite-type tricarboxylate transporter receptor subunit TctC
MFQINRRYLLRAAQSIVLACVSFSAMAQSDATPARIIVGFPAGGSFDAVARLLADKLRVELKRPVLVDNRSGAGGRLAVDALKAAPRDGSVMMLGPDALVALYPFTMRKINYDPVKDLVPIGTVAEFPFVFAAGSEPPAKTLGEYIAWAKKNPDKANYGIPARGAPHHFFGIVLSKTIGLRMDDVPYQGSSPMLIGLIGGQISAGIDVLGSPLEQHRAGTLRILAVSAERRVPQLPDVPTFAELGYPGITGMGFNALYAPAGTSKEVVATWSRALVKVLASPDVREQLINMGSLPVGKGPEELAARSAESAARWEPVIKASGFIAD